jgi:hypothetical protein
VVRIAFECFEERSDKSWICTRSTTVRGRNGDVMVRAGQVFAPKTVFAGHADFADYLTRHSVEAGTHAPE